jgi:hypothetical protein
MTAPQTDQSFVKDLFDTLLGTVDTEMIDLSDDDTAGIEAIDLEKLVTTDMTASTKDKISDESIRAAQRKFAKVYQAFFEQWETQQERSDYADSAGGKGWIGSHSCSTANEHSSVIAWSSNSDKIYTMGPKFYVALARWNRKAEKDGFTPIRFSKLHTTPYMHANSERRPLPKASDFWSAFHGIGEPLSFAITS